MSDEVSARDFGRLEQSVITLTTAVEKLTAKVEEVEGRLTLGRGVAIGVLILCGGVGAAAHSTLEHILFK